MDFFCTLELDYLAPHDITHEIEVGDIGAATIWGGSSSASVNNDTSNTKKKEIFGLCVNLQNWEDVIFKLFILHWRDCWCYLIGMYVRMTLRLYS